MTNQLKTLTKEEVAKIHEVLDTCPFWVLEDALHDRSADLAQHCESCESLREALDTGVNAVYMRIGSADDFEDEMVGYKTIDGTYSLNAPYRTEILDTYPVEFDELDYDEDQMTIAYFRPARDE